jgi:hypothetical protein
MNMYHSESALSDLDLLKTELLAAEGILDTEFSFDRAEPHYVRCLEIIGGQNVNRSDVVLLITSLFLNGSLSDEPIAFLMHKLRWPEVRQWAEEELRRMANPKANGRPLEKIIAAYDIGWENRIFYKTFSSK